MNPFVIHQDSDFAIVNKPAGLLVHPTSLTSDRPTTLQDWLQEQLSSSVFPVHRLDRPTSGVMVFALNSEAARILCAQFANQQVQKSYIALVRGHLRDEHLVDHPLTDKMDGPPTDKAWPAQTLVKPLFQVEIPLQIDRYPVSQYSLVEAEPKTGRTHQIRRHLKHLNHPIIGDVNHGNSKHNRYFEQRFGVKRLYLHARSLSFRHPKSGQPLSFTAHLPQDFMTLIKELFPLAGF